MKKLISEILSITILLMLLSTITAAEAMPEYCEITDFNLFINDELQQITIYRNNQFFQTDKKEYVPLQVCMEKLECTFERKSETNITIKTPDDRVINMRISEKTISYTGGVRGVHRVPWEYFELDGVIYYPLDEFPELIDCEVVYEGKNIYLDMGEYLKKSNVDTNIGRKVNVAVYVNDVKIETSVYKNRKTPSVQGPDNLSDYVQLKPIAEALETDLYSADKWNHLESEQTEIDGELYVPFSTIRSIINGSLKQNDYDNMHLYSADYVRKDIPETLEEAYKALDELLAPEDIAYIKELSEEDIIELHFGLGMWIRNNWLYPTNSRLTKELLELKPDFSHPDDMSSFILLEYNRYLNSGSAISENSDIKFDDLSVVHWAYSDIMALVKSSVLFGYEDGTFRPDNNITHAEMAKIITIAFDLQGNNESRDELTSDNIKRDIKNYSSDEWWSEFALIAVDYYYPGGDSSVYKSADEVNRRQLAAALVNILNPEYDFNYTTTGYSVPTNWRDILGSEFSDFYEEDDWHYDAYINYKDGYFLNSPKQIYIAKTMGLITGYEDGTFRPNDGITRAEFCAIVNRALTLHEKYVLNVSE